LVARTGGLYPQTHNSFHLQRTATLAELGATRRTDTSDCTGGAWLHACDSHLPGRCQHWRRSLPQAIKVRGGWLSSTQWPIARTSDTASRQVRSMAYVLEGSGLVAPCAAREAEQRR
jgi:hypothetical protein